MAVRKPETSEYLSKDLLDEDFLKVFEQFRRFQILLGSCRVDARHRFVTAPTVFQKMYSVFIIITLFLMYLIAIYYSENTYYTTYYLHILSLAVIYFHFSFYFLSILNARFFNNSANMNFYMKLSQIDHVLKIDYYKTIKNNVYRLNLITLAVTILIFCFVFGIVFFTNDIVILSVSVTALLITHTTVLMEINFCSNLLVYLTVHVELVNYILSSHLNKIQNKLAKEEESIPKKFFIKTLGSRFYDFKEYDLDLYLKAIFTAYTHFQDVYKFQIFLFTCKVVLYMVITFEFTLLTLRSNNPDFFAIIVLSTLTATDVVGLLTLCIRCEYFEREIKATKLLTINVMLLYYNGPLRGRAKKIYRLIEDTPPRFRVYDMWELEANLFIKVCNIVTGFFVTLLQFAFL